MCPNASCYLQREIRSPNFWYLKSLFCCEAWTWSNGFIFCSNSEVLVSFTELRYEILFVWFSGKLHQTIFFIYLFFILQFRSWNSKYLDCRFCYMNSLCSYVLMIKKKKSSAKALVISIAVIVVTCVSKASKGRNANRFSMSAENSFDFFQNFGYVFNLASISIQFKKKKWLSMDF